MKYYQGIVKIAVIYTTIYEYKVRHSFEGCHMSSSPVSSKFEKPLSNKKKLIPLSIDNLELLTQPLSLPQLPLLPTKGAIEHSSIAEAVPRGTPTARFVLRS